MSPHIIPLSSEFERANAIKQLVALDVETRPYYERALLRLEVVRDVEKIDNFLEGNPRQREQIVDLIARTKEKPILEMQRVIQGMGYLMQGRVPLLNEALLNLTDFWEKIQAQLTKESFGGSGAQDGELQKVCKIGLQLCDKLRSYNILGETYTAKVKTLNRLSHDYESEFITPKQKASARLWKTVFGPVLTSGFQKVRGWTFETRAKGLSEISELYGAEVAYDIQSTYTDSHQLARDMVEWSKNDPASFWKQASSFFHVSDAPSPIVLDELVPMLSKFKECAHPKKRTPCVLFPLQSVPTEFSTDTTRKNMRKAFLRKGRYSAIWFLLLRMNKEKEGAPLFVDHNIFITHYQPGGTAGNAAA